MRQIGLSDLHHAARAVQQVEKTDQAAFCARLLWRAHVADKYVKRLKRLHPDWGDGSLRAAAMRSYSQLSERPNCPQWRAALQVVLAALEDH